MKASALLASLQGTQLVSSEQHIPYSHTDIIIAWKKDKAYPLVKETESGMLNVIGVRFVCVLFPNNIRPKE
jgi:hypothetical protein